MKRATPTTAVSDKRRKAAADEQDRLIDSQLEDEAGAAAAAAPPPPPDDDGDVDMAAAVTCAAYDAEASAAKWRRPKFPDTDPATTGIAFQWIDIDNVNGAVLPKKANGKPVPGSKKGPVPIIRLFGVTDGGNSVTAWVHGYTPYLWCKLPNQYEHTDDKANQVLRILNEQISGRVQGEEKKCAQCVLAVVFDGKKKSLLGYQSEDQMSKFFKIYVALPSMVSKLKRVLEDGITLPGCGRRACPTYESNVAFPLRYMIDNDIVGGSWLETKPGLYSMREEKEKRTYCQIEIDVVYEDLIAHACEGEWSRVAPLRVLSFDIECIGRRGYFPEAEIDPVCQIANAVTLYGESVPAFQNVFTLNSCLPIVGAQVIASETEEEMLLRWAKFLKAADVDIITGYNVQNFDIPYLVNRAKTLQKKDRSGRMRAFFEWGRIKNQMVRLRETTFQSAQMGKRENIEVTIDGRQVFDMIQYMFRNQKLSSYSLNNVSAEFLGQQKEDVHHSIISDLQKGSDDDRRRLAVYCLKDALLPQRLMDKLNVLINYIEMARVTGVPIGYLISRGQQIKVFSMLLRKCKKEGLLIPTLPKGQDESGYEGATVIEPKRAFYEKPIATLDFASLYPSIMQAYNLCYSTLLTREDAQKLDPKTWAESPSHDFFVTKDTKRGVLPQILDELLAARKRAKRDMKAATDPFVVAVQNGRQLALKISANSVYGFTGATVGQLPCLPIASSTTSYGRELLFKTKSFVEEEYTKEKGYENDAEVVYGDTDSVMIKFGCATVAETMPLAIEAANRATAIFPDPVKLEFEKIYMPYLLMNKKRYAGLLWTKAEKYDYMDTKGLETVRRDNCLLVRRVVDTCLRKILIERKVSEAIQYAKDNIADLLQNKMDISLLVITKSLSKTADMAEYVNKQAHVELAARMKKRDAGSAPQVGDRVAYVIVQAPKGTPAFAKSEDPVYVLDNSVPIDTDYYLKNQLEGPLTRIFEPIIDNVSSLFNGEHTRKVVKATPAARKGGIMMFAVKKASCVGCRTPIPVGGSELCEHCAPREAEIYARKLGEVKRHEKVFSQLWVQCQRCQGSLHRDVLCSNRDCPIFYRRKKVQIDLAHAQKMMQRITW